MKSNTILLSQNKKYLHLTVNEHQNLSLPFSLKQNMCTSAVIVTQLISLLTKSPDQGKELAGYQGF